MNSLHIVPMLFFIFAAVSFVLTAVFLAVWTYKDAKERGLPAGLWTFLVVFFSKNFLGILLYLLIGRRDSRITCPSCAKKTSLRGKHCMECGEPIDPAKIVPFRGAKKWILALAIAFAVGIVSTLGFFVSAITSNSWENLYEKMDNVSVGAISNGFGNEWTYSAMYSSQEQTREFYVNTKEDDTLVLHGNASSGKLSVLVAVGDETPFVVSLYPAPETQTYPSVEATMQPSEETNGTSESTSVPALPGSSSDTKSTYNYDLPVGTRIRLTLITDDARNVDFSASLS